MLKNPAWILFEAALNDEVCDEWIEIGRRANVQMATTFNSEGKTEEDPHRKTDVRWLYNHGESQEIHETLWKYAEVANQHLNLDIDNLPPLQFTEYSDVGHHYGMHHDVNFFRQDEKHRKLSIVVQLTDPNDCEGGLLSFARTENPKADALIKRGSVICFPSYLLHGVSPITEGSRTSLVGWFEGPRWK